MTASASPSAADLLVVTDVVAVQREDEAFDRPRSRFPPSSACSGYAGWPSSHLAPPVLRSLRAGLGPPNTVTLGSVTSRHNLDTLHVIMPTFQRPG